MSRSSNECQGQDQARRGQPWSTMAILLLCMGPKRPLPSDARATPRFSTGSWGPFPHMTLRLGVSPRWRTHWAVCRVSRIDMLFQLTVFRPLPLTGISNKNALDPALAPSAGASPKPPPDINAILNTLDSQLKTLYAALPARTPLVLFTGHSDPRRMVELNARKSAFESALRLGKTSEEMGTDNRWSAADGRELEAEVEKAKRGLLFMSVKDVS